ncbi:hypothetical protein ABIB40_003956 [Pedobacter sp. UYP30]|uniref:hypothetical protein n=1 Tax=Pedobacter sp. UYP30 TaxID=1756400 RepID=UPI0033976876
MKLSMVGLLLSSYFLAGSIIFPLSDFSLIRDVPGMYRSYSEVRSGHPDIFDFVGDYLLHGKEIFGNNAHDARPKNPGALQFQHQPTLSIYYSKDVWRLVFNLERPLFQEPHYRITYYLSEYHCEHFRPPIV